MYASDGRMMLVANNAYESVRKPKAATRKTCVSKPWLSMCHGNQLPSLVRGPYQNLLHPT